MASKFQETNSFVLDEFLDTFGREFCKHEVLWKPQPNCEELGIQSATHVAHRALAQALNLSLEVVLELLETFPAACLDLISRYELRRRIDAGCRMPDWLTLLAGPFRLVNKSRKCNKSAVFARHELVRALCESARMGLGAEPAVCSAGGSANGTAAETEDEASPLRSAQAVAYFVARYGVSEKKVLPAWRSALELSVVKLRASLVAGDRVGLLPFALRPAAAERALADLALLHDRRLSQITVLTPAKLRKLVLLFQLILAATLKYDEGRRLSAPAGTQRTSRDEFRFDESAPVESSDDEPHPENNPELVTFVTSSDTGDNEISHKVPVLLDEARAKESCSDKMEKTNTSYRERESYISSKSETRNNFPTKYWYEESKSNSSEKRKAVWALVYTNFIKRGGSASLISLQHRWVELLHLTRSTLLKVWRSDYKVDKNVHPLLLAIAYWYPKIVTDELPSWKRLVSERQIVLESDIKDIISKYQINDNFLLNVSEILSFQDLLTTYVIHNNLTDAHSQSNSNATNKHVDYQIHKENPTSIINKTDKDLKQESQAINNELNVNNNVIPMFDQIDPSQAKVSITIFEDSDEDDNSTNMTETTSDFNNLNESNSERGATYLRDENDHIPYNLENNLTEIAMKNIEKELKDNVNCFDDPINLGSDLFDENNSMEINENINDNNDLLKAKQRGSQGLEFQDESSLLEPCESVIDEKLVNLSRVVITPIEHLPEWKKHSRNGVIKCRNFSVRNFTKPVIVTSKQLSKCKPYININNNCSEKCEDENYGKNKVRIKFEDDSFETDFDFGDDINNGIKYQKYIELYTMTDKIRKNRIKLTRKLKLSRTYFSLKFWSLDSNIELLKLCKPISIKLNKGIPRVAKRVELSDITEVRRINRSILTAQVSPTIDTTVPYTQRSCASQEAVNSTNNSVYLDSGTTRKTNNSLSSAVDSQELLNILPNYAVQTKINEKSDIESVTKDITSNCNLMDSILETMRLADKNYIQNSTLQQNPFPSSEPSDSCDRNISATNTLRTTHKYTEEVKNNSINNSWVDATASTIHLSSNHTKDLYIKHLQEMNNTPFNPKEAKMPNVGDVKDMVLLLVKQFDSKTRQDYNMKLNRCSLKKHLRKFEDQQRALVKKISNLTINLPQYVVNIKPKSLVTKNSTAANKEEKINRLNWQQSKEVLTLPSSRTENITDVAFNTNSEFDDDDCELNLVIDEENLEQSDNVDSNNSQYNKINTNKDIQETSNIRKNDKKEKNIKKARKRLKQPKEIPEIEKPILNEYQEWHRQKTMALKYFTIPMSDTSKLTAKDKIAKQKSTTTSTELQSSGCQTIISIERTNTEDLRVATTPTEQKSNGCQTNISIKRKNTEDLATTSTVSDRTKRSKLDSNESNVVYISDTSSDDDVQITGCYIAKDTNKNNRNTTYTAQPDTHRIDKVDNGNNVVFLNDTSKKQATGTNVCVINRPVVDNTQHLYLILNGNQTPALITGAIEKTQNSGTINNPIGFQVLSKGTLFPILSPVVQKNNTQQTNEQCQRTNECKCIKCENNLRDNILTSTLDVIQNVISLVPDSGNDEPSTSLPTQNDCVVKEATTVREYLEGNKKLTPLIKVGRSEKVLFLCSKYIILTDVNIPSVNATYRTTTRINNKKKLSQVLVPSDSKGSVLLLGPKKESDFILCECQKGTSVKCNLCQRINMILPNSTKIITIGGNYYKHICEKTNKYVRLNERELATNSRSVLEGNPHLILVNKMFFKKLTDSPSTYVWILSAPPDAATLRRLVQKKVVLYALDITQSEHTYTPLKYKQTDGQVTINHTDDQLINVLQWILN